MKRLLGAFFGSFLIITFTWVAMPAQAADGFKYPLMAGQHLEVGVVKAEADGDGNVVVTYAIDTENHPGLVLTEVHLSVGDVPKKSAPGRFPYHAEFDTSDGVTEYSITVEGGGSFRMHQYCGPCGRGGIGWLGRIGV